MPNLYAIWNVTFFFFMLVATDPSVCLIVTPKKCSAILDLQYAWNGSSVHHTVFAVNNITECKYIPCYLEELFVMWPRSP